MEFITGNETDPAKPLFLHVALPEPHTRWLPTQRFQGTSPVSDYEDFEVMVDDEVGRLLASLEETSAAKNTLFIFTNDNGPVWYDTDMCRYGHSSNSQLRGMKGDAWEANTGCHSLPAGRATSLRTPSWQGSIAIPT